MEGLETIGLSAVKFDSLHAFKENSIKQSLHIFKVPGSLLNIEGMFLFVQADDYSRPCSLTGKHRQGRSALLKYR